MRFLILPMIAMALTGCNNYQRSCSPDNACAEPCTNICKEEQKLAEENELKALSEMAATFEKAISEKINVTPLYTVTAFPITGLCSMMSTKDDLDVKSARQFIIDAAETLLEVANCNAYLSEKATKFPLTLNDLDIFIDSSEGNGSVRSVSLIRGMIEYDAFDSESNSYKIIKQEPLTHAQAKAVTTNCCGSFFISKE